MTRLMVFAFLGTAYGQIFVPVGTATDGCVGGSIYSSPALRYSSTSFTCALDAGAPGFYQVALGFREPNVTTVGGRVFKVLVNGYSEPSLKRVDLVALGATDPSITETLTTTVFSTDGFVRVALTTIVRSAVLSSISVAPVAAQTQTTSEIFKIDCAANINCTSGVPNKSIKISHKPDRILVILYQPAGACQTALLPTVTDVTSDVVQNDGVIDGDQFIIVYQYH